MIFVGRLFFWFSIAVMLFANTVFAFDNRSGGGHLTITDKAATLIKETHSGDDKFRNWIEKEALPYFLTGAHDEDCTPIKKGTSLEVPIDLEWPNGPNGKHWGNFFEHFYNPQTGAGLAGFRTAIQRAKDYEKSMKQPSGNKPLRRKQRGIVYVSSCRT